MENMIEKSLFTARLIFEYCIKFLIFFSADEGNDENEDPNSTFDIAKNTTEKGDSISKSFVKEKSFASVQSNASQDAYVRGKLISRVSKVTVFQA